MKLPDLSLICVILILLVGCASMPDITPRGKVSPDKTTLVPFWNAGKHAEDMMESKGWKKPKPNNKGIKWLWIGIAGVCASLSIASFIIAYVTAPCHKALGVGVILGFVSVIATGISAIVGIVGWVVGVLLVIVFLWIGIKLRNVDLLNAVRNLKSGTK